MLPQQISLDNMCCCLKISSYRRRISGPFFSRSLALKSSFKSHKVTTFLAQKRGLSKKHHHMSKNFISLNRAREQERKEKGTTNSAPKLFNPKETRSEPFLSTLQNMGVKFLQVQKIFSRVKFYLCRLHINFFMLQKCILCSFSWIFFWYLYKIFQKMPIMKNS